MSIYRSAMLTCIVFSACSQPNGDVRDTGGSLNDLSAPGSPNDLSSGDGTSRSWTTLGLLAGGLGGNGYTNDRGLNARFSLPNSVVADNAGNLYVADTGNQTIRKIVLATGEVTTIAGIVGIPGSADGTGATAQFSDPHSVTTDGQGNLYVADINNSTIRKVVLATGVVSTIAGTPGMSGSVDGTGAAARFNAPRSIDVDGMGNLYVVDSRGATIRKLVLATGVVSTIAGAANSFGSTDGTGASARFLDATGVATDRMGNLYVADSSNFTIRKIVLVTGNVTTIAGTAGLSGSVDATGTAARFSSPYGLVVDSAGNLYVTDTNSSIIRKIVVATGVVSTIAGSAGMSGSSDGTGSTARFAGCTGIAKDNADNIYVTDRSAIRKVESATAVVSTIAGSAKMTGNVDGTGAAARFNAPFGMAADNKGTLYIADTSNHSIRKIVLATGVVSTIAGSSSSSGSADGIGTAARFNGPYGLTTDSRGDIYVADTLNCTIRKIVLSTGIVSTVAGSPGMKGNADGTGTAARFDSPSCVTSDGKDNLYVADIVNNNIRKIVISTGVVSTIAGNGSGLSSPFGITTDGAGNLYVADTVNSTIRKIVVTTGVVSTIAGSAGMKGSSDGIGAAARFNVPYGVTTDSNGNLYVADTGNSTIRRVTLTGGAVTTVVGIAGYGGVKLGPIPAQLSGPVSLAFLGNDQLIIADVGEDSILIAR